MIAVAGFFMMAVLRAIMGVIQKGVNEATGTSTASGSGKKQPAARDATAQVSPGGELKKCAACGVYNAAANSVTRAEGGATVYYCSTTCRAKAAA